MADMLAENQSIRIRGARVHNLKNVNVEIPRGRFVVLTGMSGSGKSSLAFDTIYAEGQRRYVESLSAYARQFLEVMQKPDVDSIEGLSPAISIEQKTTSKNPRSTVGTVTEIHDYMRLLWARIGIPYSPATGLPIESQSISQMVDKVLELPQGSRLYLLAPVVRDRKGEFKTEIKLWIKQGLTRARIDGEFYTLDEAPELDKKYKHSIEIVIDRLVVKEGIETRLADSFETACRMSDGIAIIEFADKDNTPDNLNYKKPIIFSQKFACPVSGFTIAEIEPRLFSFNNPNGACSTCDGLGVQLKFDAGLIVPDNEKTIQNGAVVPWSKGNSPLYFQTLKAICEKYGDNLNTPWKELKAETKKTIIYGSGKEKINFIYEDGSKRYETTKAFEGVLPNLERRWKDTESSWIREDLEKYQSAQTCPSCNGKRLRPEALAVKIDMMDISEVSTYSIRNACKWFDDIDKVLTERQKEIGARILKEIRERLRFLVNVGLDYLTLHRSSATLSGGESQRIRLASQIGSGLTGVLYVLDEPSIGLHQRDNTMLLESLKGLRDLGNSVLVVEHDEEAILTADHVVDMGPRAGVNGGKVIAQGTPKEIEENPDSITGAYLRGDLEVPIPEKRRKPKKSKMLVLKGASGNNLKNVTLNLPLGLLTCITGVSGGGKSTLIIETLYKILARRLNGAAEQPAPYEDLEGYHQLDKVIDINQSPIGRTPRSNPATYTGTFDPIRQWFANLPDAKARGYGPGRFSFNVKGGRCEACQGDGVQKIEMHFLPDVYVECDTCHGQRYNRETLEVKYRNKSISDVLRMTVDEGAQFFSAVPAIRDKLLTLARVGLGYVKIGQPATTLSGGEAQRVKLAKELARRSTGRTIYILDEPTTGLHFEDTRKLMEVLQELTESGNTIVIIEHNLDVIKTADWIVDLGPEGGDGGGEIIAEGTPEDVAKTDTYTGKYLKQTLEVHELRRKRRNKIKINK